MEKSPPLRLHDSSSALSPLSQPACLRICTKRSTVVLHRKESDVRYLCLAIQCGKWVHLFHVQKVWNDVLVQLMFATYAYVFILVGYQNWHALLTAHSIHHCIFSVAFRFGSFPRRDIPRTFIRGLREVDREYHVIKCT